MRIQFEGQTFSDILTQIDEFAAHIATLTGLQALVAATVAAPQSEDAAAANGADEPATAAAAPKKPGRPKKAAKAAPKQEQEPEEEEVEAVDEDEADEPQDMRAAVDLEKLKNEQLDRLRDLFSAGKGPFVRSLLKAHGGGAKVFPEVDAKRFPAIKAAIDKELN